MVVFGGSSLTSGFSGTKVTNDIHVYSPTSDVWTRHEPGGPTPYPRLSPAVVTIDDNCMIVVGGTVSYMGRREKAKDVYLYNISSDMCLKYPCHGKKLYMYSG